jgi:hypothetical protein
VVVIIILRVAGAGISVVVALEDELVKGAGMEVLFSARGEFVIKE